MKKIITSVFILICAVTNAQIMHDFTETFDSVFSHISRTDATTGVLYNRVLPFSNATSFNSLINSSVDTITSEDFLQSCYELYLSAFNPSANVLPDIDELENAINADAPTVNIGVLHYKYNTMDSSVASIKLYFDNDSILREDASIHQSLYVENEIFMTAPLLQNITTGTTYFKFSRHFLFENCDRKIKYYIVDFNDGFGTRLIFADEDKTIPVTYQNTGSYVVSVQAVMDDNTVFYSFSYVFCQPLKPENKHLYADYYITAQIPFTDYSGKTKYGKGTMRIYFSNSDYQLRKPLLIIDGFDPTNTRKFDYNTDSADSSFWGLLYYENGRKHIGDSLISKYGYDVILLDLDDGGDYIERNAMVCIEAINKINTLLSNSGSEEQIVIIGPSMGGQIARYALSYMEQNNTIATTNYGYHNCRLWISMDSPHRGANISLGAQAAIYYFRGLKAAKETWEKTLNCPAAQQMLIHHFNGDASTVYHTYYNNLSSLGYPTLSRNIAISDGGLNNVSDLSESMLALRFTLPWVLYNLIGEIRLYPDPNTTTQVFKVWHVVLGIPFYNTWTITGNNNCSIDAAPGGTYKTFDIFKKKIKEKIGASTFPINIHNHCFMPIPSTIDISSNMNYCTDISSRDLVAEGLTPFDSYAGIMDSNMYHVTFNQHLVDYMLNEIETYIVGLREIQLCTRPNYNLHLPQDSVATVTWTSSDNIRILTTNNPYEVSIVPLSTGDGWISAEVSTLKHRKTLAHYPIHIISNDNLTPIVQGTTIQGQSLVIDDERYLTSDTFCVENGKTMTLTGTLHCSSGTRIIVRPGGKLVIDGGVLTSSCANEMWQGIEVVGDRTKHQTASFQGVVELRNEAIIENAHCAIRTGLGDDNWNTTGGIIKADNTHFINNQRAVEFLSYVDTVPVSGALRDNYSYFNKCEFKLDNNNLFGYNDCDFIDHVTLWRVKGVKFKGCSFTNQTNEHYTRKHAIYALDAGITLDSYCSNSQIFLPTGCDCPASYSTYNSFSGFSTAVEVNTSGDQFAVRINHALFNNNETAILIKGNPFTTISRCEVNLQNVPTYTLDNRGLVLDHCSGYKIEDNTFSRTTYYPQQLVSTGIYVNNSGDSVDNFLHLNNFTNMNYGVYVKGNNGDSQYGLQITCSDFDHNGYDIFMSSGSSLKCVQGWTNLGADNDFSNTRISSLYNAGTQFVTYYHSHDVEHVPYNVTSSHISVVDSATANGCESTLCNLGISPITPTPFLLTNFSSMMNNYISAETATQQSNMDGMTDGNSEETLSSTFQTEMSSLIGMRQNLSEIYYESVRALMADSLLNLNELEQWHTVAQPISDPYSLTETRFQNGNANSTVVAETIEETYNYADFHSLKTHCWSGRDGINWYELSNLQIEQLKAIAELNTGRSSVMAKGVLCFIFGICYEDDWSTEEAGETRSAKATPNNNETSSLVVYPNPTDNLLYVELLNSVIENVLVYDLQGRVVESAMSIKDGFTLINVSTIPAGVYLIRVTDEQGSLYHQKFVKK